MFVMMVIDLCGFTRGDQEVFFSARRTAATPFWTCGVKAPDDDDDGVVVVVVLCANIFGRKSESKKVNGRERVAVVVVGRALLVLLFLPGGSFSSSSSSVVFERELLVVFLKDNTKTRLIFASLEPQKVVFLFGLHTKHRGGEKRKTLIFYSFLPTKPKKKISSSPVFFLSFVARRQRGGKIKRQKKSTHDFEHKRGFLSFRDAF